MKNPFPLLRITGMLEGLSWLALLGVGMPLKYVYDIPKAVSITGMIHGILFTLFCFLLLQTMIAAKWQKSRAALLFIAALMPFGPFIIDKQVREYEKEFLNGPEKE